MTLLNIANDGYYNVMVALYRTLIVEGPTHREKLIEICSDKSDGSRVRLQQTLNRWTQLGLFREEEKIVSLETAVEKTLGTKKNLGKATLILPSVIRRIVFKGENNDLFWDQEKSRSADLSRGLSWLLTQDIYDLPLNLEDVQQLEARQLSDKSRRLVQNDVRFNGFRTWTSYLGFSWQSKAAMIDPTGALQQDLPLIFGDQKELTAEAFVKQVASVLPVLDGGRYRLLVEESLNPAHWQKPDRQEILSTSLSRALWRLETKGLLKLESRADAKSNRVLQRSGGAHWNTFTHVRLQGSLK